MGYSTPNGVRLELEGSFENFELKNSNKCTLKNAYKYFAAAAKLKDSNDEIAAPAEMMRTIINITML
ncbi:P44/Msp2 family outer membrane protein [Neoehrlichia mikurensis]|uniref:P44/Msp2 family outer membrane protein n=1 Tax=Neoehrlichia mikurensis TaxID=89586 RepID=A0ABY5EYX9_9RICK|nr:P44/Msp2 family outer membrane protein [Neoehrlichia mikurensis]UTO56854.1 P44/Msp2 family outer membrane protein [Neoehrlichia mikurensis]